MRLHLADAQIIRDADASIGDLYIAGKTVSPPLPDARMISLDGYLIVPGLINAHDHLELNHFPRTRFRSEYANAHVWGEDVSAQLDKVPFRDLQAYPLWERCLIGGLKNLLSGVTTVVHHNPLHRPLKRRWFPVDVLQAYGWAHSLYFETPQAIQQKYKASAPHPFFIHLAEGTDKIASSEQDQLVALGVLGHRTVLVHGVGLDADQRQMAIQQGASLVWCPSSNHYLLGTTAEIEDWLTADRLMLGSDSRLTADGDLLDEMRAAMATDQIDARTLLDSVTTTPVRLLRLHNKGRLNPGYSADLVVFQAQGDPYQRVVHAQRRDIALVIRHGKVIWGVPELVGRFARHGYVPIMLDGEERLMRQSLVRRIQRMKLHEPGLSVK